MPRQSLVHLLDVEQRSGQFAVPLASGSDPFIDTWIATAPEKAPRVAELGLYYLEGVARKFGMYWTSLKSSLIFIENLVTKGPVKSLITVMLCGIPI